MAKRAWDGLSGSFHLTLQACALFRGARLGNTVTKASHLRALTPETAAPRKHRHAPCRTGD